MYGSGLTEDMVASCGDASLSSDSPSHSLLYNLSVLKQKFHEVQSLVTIFISPDQRLPSQVSTAMAIDSMGTLIQEIMVTASSMMFTCQQIGEERRQRFYPSDQTLHWNGESGNILCNTNNDDNKNQGTITRSTNYKTGTSTELPQKSEIDEGRSSQGFPSKSNCEVIELNVEDLLAKYTHYCQVCGKGFKRDANLRMHMRAHGDEYKSSAALINPAKRIERNKKEADSSDLEVELPRKKYSCPHEGCRWNKKHEKFQPLKSMICAKNHYKRSHCPKMYVCKRCNGKQFSVLSDLRTHEKHCGDHPKWQCSCGTTFCRKDKLLGHVALFVGHTPAIDIPSRQIEKVDEQLHHQVPICE